MHRTCVATRTKALKELVKQGKKKAPQHMMEEICHVIRAECTGTVAEPKITHTPAVKKAIRQQYPIGGQLMLRGFLAKEWGAAMHNSGVQKPEKRMISL